MISQEQADGCVSEELSTSGSVRVDGLGSMATGCDVQYGSNLPVTGFPHALSPMATPTEPTSTLNNDTHTTADTHGLHSTSLSTSPTSCPTACSSTTLHATPLRTVHGPTATDNPEAPPVSKRRLTRFGARSGDAVPDACTVRTVGHELRDEWKKEASEVEISAMDERPVESTLMDPSNHNSSYSTQPSATPSDAQVLYWTLVDDGALPDGFLEDFVLLMQSVESAAARQARTTFLDNPQADLFVHEFHKSQRLAATEEKSTADMFAQAVALPPRRYKTRLERTLFSGPTPRKDAEEQERSRWILVLATLLMDTPHACGATAQGESFGLPVLGSRPASLHATSAGQISEKFSTLDLLGEPEELPV